MGESLSGLGTVFFCLQGPYVHDRLYEMAMGMNSTANRFLYT